MSLVILLSVFTLTCPNNNSLPLDGKHAESRHIWSFEKKKTCASNKGDSQTKNTFAKCHNQLLVAAAPDAKTCMRKFHGKLFWPCTTLVGNAGLGWRLAVVQACTKYQKQAGKSSRTACARALV